MDCELCVEWSVSQYQHAVLHSWRGGRTAADTGTGERSEFCEGIQTADCCILRLRVCVGRIPTDGRTRLQWSGVEWHQLITLPAAAAGRLARLGLAWSGREAGATSDPRLSERASERAR